VGNPEGKRLRGLEDDIKIQNLKVELDSVESR
jgi:hypothetical protein